MLNALKKLFGIKAAEKAQPVPYKVEAPKVEEFPFPSKPAKVAKPKAEKKPAVKAKTARKPKTPKA